MFLQDLQNTTLISSSNGELRIGDYISHGRAQTVYTLEGNDAGNVLKIPNFDLQLDIQSEVSKMSTREFNERLLRIVETSGCTQLPPHWKVIDIPTSVYSGNIEGIAQPVGFMQTHFKNITAYVSGNLPNLQRYALLKQWEPFFPNETEDTLIDLPLAFESRSSLLQEFFLLDGKEIFFDWDTFLTSISTRKYFKYLIEKGYTQEDIEAYYRQKWNRRSESVVISRNDVKSPEVLFNRGIDCLNEHDYDSAIKYFLQIPVNTVEEYQKAQYNISEIYFQRFKRTFNPSDLIQAYRHICNIDGYSSLIEEIEVLSKEYGIDLDKNSI
ncbi:hypothetical protein LAT59_00385 [Candidatus Gracilibacteria bacterium]|nr:hypothetical protein [Candidatus Gracilibacteria bacterium]